MSFSAGLTMYFLFNDPATTEIYSLSLHDALPICSQPSGIGASRRASPPDSKQSHPPARCGGRTVDRKSTRLNSSHANISYAVFCLKNKDIEITRSAHEGQNYFAIQLGPTKVAPTE